MMSHSSEYDEIMLDCEVDTARKARNCAALAPRYLSDLVAVKDKTESVPNTRFGGWPNERPPDGDRTSATVLAAASRGNRCDDGQNWGCLCKPGLAVMMRFGP